MIHPTRAPVSGPLASFVPGFANELLRQGYTSSSARQQIQLVAHLSRWLNEAKLDLDRLQPEDLDRFLNARRSAGYTNHHGSRALLPLLSYLRGLGVVPVQGNAGPQGPVEAMVERYRCYLGVERGLARTTVEGYVHAIRPLLCQRIRSGGNELSLEQMNAAEVTAFVVARCREQSRGAAQMTVTALRSLLRFLHLEGIVDQSLAAAVPSVVGRHRIGLPKGLEPQRIERLLASCDRRTRIGRRDFAILVGLVRLGLRIGEMARLALGDIDWRAGEVAIHGKGTRVDRLPLPVDVGEAWVAHLRRGRPSGAEGRTVFVRVRAPHRALSAGGVAAVVYAAARRAGLDRVHPHQLRHTVATELLGAGASLSEVGQLLRHRRSSSTAIYAKVDRQTLRGIARPWPGDAV